MIGGDDDNRRGGFPASGSSGPPPPAAPPAPPVAAAELRTEASEEIGHGLAAVADSLDDAHDMGEPSGSLTEVTGGLSEALDSQPVEDADVPSLDAERESEPVVPVIPIPSPVASASSEMPSSSPSSSAGPGHDAWLQRREELLRKIAELQVIRDSRTVQTSWGSITWKSIIAQFKTDHKLPFQVPTNLNLTGSSILKAVVSRSTSSRVP